MDLNLTSKESAEIQEQLNNALNERIEKDKADMKSCEDEILEILKKYDCTLVNDSHYRSGQLVSSFISVIKNPK